jgi:magnesium transporter
MTAGLGKHGGIGQRPGSLDIPEGSPKPKIRLVEYDVETVIEREITDLAELRPYANTKRTTWIDIQGLGDEALLRGVAEIFGIHELALADAVNAPQRAKMDAYPHHLFLIGRAPDAAFDPSRPVPQVGIVIGDGYLVSFQERHFGFFDTVRARIRHGAGRIRSSGSSYLAFALIDCLVDHYFPVIARIAEQLDDLEEKALVDPDPEFVSRLHKVQRRITTLRRVIRPQVEVLYQLSNVPTHFIPDETRLFMRDAYDHARQIEGRLDAAREMAVDTMNAVLATLGHRQNEIMKMLTLVGSIFIPLTFVAGIYGMNFEYMPELQTRLGYPMVIGVMFVVVVAMVSFFRHKGWIGRRPPR